MLDAQYQFVMKRMPYQPFRNFYTKIDCQVWAPLFESSWVRLLFTIIWSMQSLSHYLTTSFYSFHIVGRVTTQKAIIFFTICLAICSPSQKYGNALKILYDKKIPISKMLEVTMLMKDYDRRACRHPSCVEASLPENLCVCCW